MLSCNEFLLLLLYHLCVLLVSLQCICPLLYHFTCLRLFRYQIPYLTELIAKLSFLTPLRLNLNMLLHCAYVHLILTLYPLHVARSQIRHQLLLLLVKALIHLQVGLLLNFQHVFHYF